MTPEQLKDIYFLKVQGSEALKAYLDYYERIAEDHPDHTYQFLSDMTDKVIRERRQRLNTQALVAAAGGGLTNKPAVPGLDATDDSQKQTRQGRGGKGEPKGGGKGEPKGKGKGKGKGKDGEPPVNKGCPYHFFGACIRGHAGTGCTQGTHKQFPSKADREHYAFKKQEANLGTWEKGKFKYPDGVAVPAKVNAENTPPGSPRAGRAE